MVDGETELYNYNGRAIPPATLKSILREVQLPDVNATESDVDSGRVSGLVFISERTNGLETLHLALLFNNTTDSVPEIQVFNFAEVFGTFDGVRMEDSGCFGGDYLVYVSTMEPVEHRRQPWTAVYKTNLWTGETQRLTPPGSNFLLLTKKNITINVIVFLSPQCRCSIGPLDRSGRPYI